MEIQWFPDAALQSFANTVCTKTSLTRVAGWPLLLKAISHQDETIDHVTTLSNNRSQNRLQTPLPFLIKPGDPEDRPLRKVRYTLFQLQCWPRYHGNVVEAPTLLLVPACAQLGTCISSEQRGSQWLLLLVPKEELGTLQHVSRNEPIFYSIWFPW